MIGAEKMMILVQTGGEKLVSCKETPEADEKNVRLEKYHVVDLEKGTTQFVYSHLSFMGATALLSIGDSVYLVGGSESSRDYHKARSFTHNNPTLNFYMDAACLKLKANADEDGKVSVSAESVTSPYPFMCGNCASSTVLDGKIFTFGNPCLMPSVFDPLNNIWESYTPSLPDNLVPSSAVLPDPHHNRIFMLLSDYTTTPPHSLYSFEPKTIGCSADGDWTLLKSNFYSWTDVAVVADDLIFFYHRKDKTLVQAFDLRTLQFLPVRWSNKLAGSDCDCVITDFVYMGFKKLLRLSDTSLCLAGSWRLKANAVPPSDGLALRLLFLKFTFKRDGPNVNLSPQLIQRFTLPHTGYEDGMVPIF